MSSKEPARAGRAPWAGAALGKRWGHRDGATIYLQPPNSTLHSRLGCDIFAGLVGVYFCFVFVFVVVFVSKRILTWAVLQENKFSATENLEEAGVVVVVLGLQAGSRGCRLQDRRLFRRRRWQVAESVGGRWGY